MPLAVKIALVTVLVLAVAVVGFRALGAAQAQSTLFISDTRGNGSSSW